VYFNRKCFPGPYLNRELVKSLPECARGAVVGPEKHNVMRMCMQSFVSSAVNPKQVSFILFTSGNNNNNNNNNNNLYS
jgi:hypothetical protein